MAMLASTTKLVSLEQEIQTFGLNSEFILAKMFDIQKEIQQEMQYICQMKYHYQQEIQKYKDDSDFVQKETEELNNITIEELRSEKTNHMTAFRKFGLYLFEKDVKEREIYQPELHQKLAQCISRENELVAILSNLEDHIMIILG
jgi:hypothetical protein